MLSEKIYKIEAITVQKNKQIRLERICQRFSSNVISSCREELLMQQRATREEKKRLRRALKELEAQFEARAGRRMQREDRGPQVTSVYESYKQAKAKLRLIDALIAKKA